MWTKRTMPCVKSKTAVQLVICIVLAMTVIFIIKYAGLQPISAMKTYFTLTNTSSVNIAENQVGTKTIVIYKPPHWINIQEANFVLSNVCEYKNCNVTRNTTQMQMKDAIMYTITLSYPFPKEPPIKSWQRNPDQVWLLFWAEPPPRHHRVDNTSIWRNTFNWSMSYSHDSDVFRPYGKVSTVQSPPSKNYHEIFQNKSGMAAWAVSHCKTGSKREVYVSKLREKGVTVDIFGKCGNGRNSAESLKNLLNNKFKFYLAFENHLCKDYVTEKFYKYFQYDIVLVVRGAANYSNIVPRNTLINTDDFKSVKELADHLKKVASSERLYTEYLKNKDKFTNVAFGNTEGFCSLCEKLNHIEQNRRIYSDMFEEIHKDKCDTVKDLEDIG